MTYLAPFFTTVFCALVILRWRSKLEQFIEDRGDQLAIQSSHCGEPIRFGGVAILSGLVLGTILLMMNTDAHLFSLLLLSALPVVIAGLAEDMGHRVSPRERLIAAMFSALAAIAMLNIWVARVDLQGFDFVLSYSVVAIAVTILFSGGFCHAVNLIDGMNGYATISVISSATGIAVLAGQSGQTAIASFATLLIVCLSGFLVINWPNARMFLGDAGAYGVGHLLVWLSIMLAWKSEGVAIPALALVLFWPIADIFHTIYRRVLARKSPFQPDKMHLHHKVRRALDMAIFGYNQRVKSNPMTIVVLLPFMVMPIATGVLLHNNPKAAWIAFLAFLLAFAAAHKVATKIAIKYRR